MSTSSKRKVAPPRKPALPSTADYLDALVPQQAGEREIEGLKLIGRSRLAIQPQARRTFLSTEMQELRESIKAAQERGEGVAGTGIFVPLLVVPLDGGYRLVAGERRLRASAPDDKWSGVEELPCLVMRADNKGVAVAQLIENLQRQGLPPIEEAAGIQDLMRQQNLSVRDVAKALGKDKGYLENRLRLLKMADDLKTMVSSREDTLKHAYYIDQVKDEPLRRELIEAVLADRASVAHIRRRIEETVRSVHPEFTRTAPGSEQGPGETVDGPAPSPPANGTAPPATAMGSSAPRAENPVAPNTATSDTLKTITAQPNPDSRESVSASDDPINRHLGAAIDLLAQGRRALLANDLPQSQRPQNQQREELNKYLDAAQAEIDQVRVWVAQDSL